MKTMTVGEFKTGFSDVLGEVRHGGRVGILFGRSRKPVAMLVPFAQGQRERVLGPLDGKAKIAFRDDFELTDEAFLGEG